MSHQSSPVPPDGEADAAVALKVRCSYCNHELEDHQHTSPCPHCDEYAVPVEGVR